MCSRTSLFTQFLVLFSAISITGEVASPVVKEETAQSSNRDLELGHHYEMGPAATVDLNKALMHYKKAAVVGNAEAQYRLGWILQFLNLDPYEPVVFGLISSASEQGHLKAKFLLAALYLKGEGTAEDPAQAFALMHETAEQGLTEGMAKLGHYYMEGIGVTEDGQLAVEWLTKAVEKGDTDAMFNLGALYANGKKVPRKFQEAKYLFYRAALDGHRQAAELVEELFEEHPHPRARKETQKLAPLSLEPMKKLKARLQRELDPDAPLIKLGISSNEVISLLGQPGSSGAMITGRGKDAVRTDLWNYPEGTVSIRDGKVIDTSVTITSPDQIKRPEKTKLERLLGYSPQVTVQDVYPFLRPSDSRYWALATGALLTEVNGGRHDMLGTCRATDASRKAKRWSLHGPWGVNTKSDFLEKLTWLEQEGHRAEFNTIGRALFDDLKFTPGASTNNVDIANVSEDKVEFVETYYKKLGKKGLIGWDFCRYVSLCRWGYVAGYLTEDEAWARIMPVARMLQRTFDSWEDLSYNFLMGKEYWSQEDTPLRGDKITDARTNLLSNELSPWKRCPWDSFLGKDPSTRIFP